MHVSLELAMEDASRVGSQLVHSSLDLMFSQDC